MPAFSYIVMAGAENGDLSDVAMWNGSGISASTLKKRTGNYSYKFLGAAYSTSWMRLKRFDYSGWYALQSHTPYFSAFFYFVDQSGSGEYKIISMTSQWGSNTHSVVVHRSASGVLSLRWYRGNTLLYQGPTNPPHSTWNYIQLIAEAVNPGYTAGRTKLLLNGVVQWDYEAPEQEGEWDSIVVGPVSPPTCSYSFYVDDCVIRNDNFGPGFPAIISKRPINGVNYLINVDPAHDAYSDVDELPHNSDVDYLYMPFPAHPGDSSAAFSVESYNIPSECLAGSIVFMVMAVVRNVNDVEWLRCTPFLRKTSPGINYDMYAGSYHISGITEYTTFGRWSAENPFTGVAFLRTELNDFLIGCHVNTISGDSRVRITSLVGQILYYTPSGDALPPTRIIDLSASEIDPTHVRLQWTAPEDDPLGGPADRYEVRYRASSQVTDENWDNVSTYNILDIPPIPGGPGNPQEMTDSYIDAGETRYYGIKSYDIYSNASLCSNSPGITTSGAADTTPPQTIISLQELSHGATTATLFWVAPYEDYNDNTSGACASYDIRYRIGIGNNISESNWGNVDTYSVVGEPTPRTPGNGETFVVTNLPSFTRISMAIKSVDSSGNISGISNVISFTTNETQDITAPSDIDDLAIVSTSDTSLSLQWTAVGDDADIGVAAEYIVKYRLGSSLTEGNWNQIGTTQVTSGVPAPGNPGDIQGMTVSDLIPNQVYYFAIKTRDSDNNFSGISNNATDTTDVSTDVTIPGTIADLSANQGTASSTSVFLTWTSVGDDGLTGRATAYDLRWSLENIESVSVWDTSNKITGTPGPSVPGTLEEFTATGLPSGVRVYFAIKVLDEVGNTSELSNSASAITLSEDAIDGMLYTSTSIRHTFLIELQADDGTYLDLNTQFQNYSIDYTGGLVGNPSISIKMESDLGIYVRNMSSINMDNMPWNGNKYGFFDQEMPFSFRGHTISSWRKRKVRIGFQSWREDGTLDSTRYIGTFWLRGVSTDNENIATLKLASINDPLTRRSASSVRFGTDPYQGLSIGALIARLINSCPERIDVSSDLATSMVEFPEQSEMVASSWGKTPGVLFDGNPSPYQYIIRCMGRQWTGNDNRIWVGFEVPGSRNTSGGAIGYFDKSTGKWKILYTPTTNESGQYPLRDQWPIAIWCDSVRVFVVTVSENTFTTSEYSFYGIKVWSFFANGSGFEYLSERKNYWPARQLMRYGRQKDPSDNFAFVNHCRPGTNDNGAVAEDLCVPFSQVIESLYDDMGFTPPVGDDEFNERFWDNYHVTGSGPDGGLDDSDESLFKQTSLSGLYTAKIHGDNPSSANIRYFLSNHWHPPILLNGPDLYVYWIENVYLNLNYPKGPGDTRWRIVRRKIAPITGPVEVWPLYNMSGVGTPATCNHFYNRHITAWCLSPNATNSNREMLVAVTEWKDPQNEQGISAQSATTRLWKITFNVVDGQNPTFTQIYTNSSSQWFENSTPALSIVTLFSGYSSDQTIAAAGSYAVGCTINRKDIRNKAYALCVFSSSGAISIYTDADYDGPTSSMPFDGFTRLSITEYLCIDQATAQLWKITISGGSATYTRQNRSLPIHDTDYWCASPGIYLNINDEESGYFPMAPGPSGDTQNRYWKRTGYTTSQTRHMAGQYPFIQLSKRITDSIDWADFEDMKCWQAIQKLKELAPHYVLYDDGEGVIHFRKREASTDTLYRLVPVSDNPYANVLAYQLQIFSWSKSIEYENTINNIEITPFAPFLTPVNTRSLFAASSTYSGQFLVNYNGSRKIKIAIRCTTGGNLITAEQAILFAWSSIAEPLFCYLGTGAVYDDEFVMIVGSRYDSGQFYLGENRIYIGDRLSVRDSAECIITNIVPLDAVGAYVKIALDRPLKSQDVSWYAPIYSTVKIETGFGEASSSDLGITFLSANLNTGDVVISVQHQEKIREGMILTFAGYGESVLVTKIIGSTISVERQKFGTISPASIPTGTKISGYIHIASTGKLYEVGDTGILFGCGIEDIPEGDSGSSTVLAGDGVIVSCDGYKLEELENILERRSVGSAADDDGTDKKISDNKFINTSKMGVIAQAYMDEFGDPKMQLSNVRMFYTPLITVGSIVEISSTRIIPNGSIVQFEVTGIQYDTRDWMMDLSLRSVQPVAGAGRYLTSTVTTGYGTRRGRRGHRRGSR